MPSNDSVKSSRTTICDTRVLSLTSSPTASVLTTPIGFKTISSPKTKLFTNCVNAPYNYKAVSTPVALGDLPSPLSILKWQRYYSALANKLFMLRIGHRGARAYAPENTVASFRKAIEIGVDAIELDVRKTRDNQIVVIHDADVKRTTNGKGLVSELTLEQIKSFSTEEGEKLPTLQEALDFLDKKVKVLIELKEVGVEEAVLSAVRERGLEKNVVIVSFLEDALQKVRELDKSVETGLIYAKHSNPVKAALELKANYLLALYRFTHSANVKKAHENGLKIIGWTINPPEEVEEYAEKGVDGIASDKPDILLKVNA
jgi:glycerophosphoryl diester phosphodiesterase